LETRQISRPVFKDRTAPPHVISAITTRSNHIRSHRAWRGLDDPNLVIVANAFDSRQAAEAVMNNATSREAMGRGGVIQSSVRIDYVDEAAAGTR